MRWLIGLLVVLNLSFFLWSSFAITKQTASTGLHEPDVGTLRLMNEMRLSEKPPSQPINSTLVSKPESMPEREETKPTQHQVAVKSTKANTTPPPLVAETLATPKPKEKIKTLYCSQGGVYEKRPQIDDIQKQVSSQVAVVDTKAIKVDIPSGYYVMIPAASSAREAKKTISALKEQGIRDTWLFNAGKYKHAISLGLFSRKSNAQQHSKKVKSKGFEVVVEQKNKSLERFSVILQSENEKSLEKAAKKLGFFNARKVNCIK